MYIHDLIKTLLENRSYPTIIEIGAHHGEDTEEIISRLNSKFTYHVFEPDPRNIPFLEYHRMLNWFKFHPKAVGNEDGTTDLYLSSGNIDSNKDSWTGSSSIKKPKEHLKAFPWCKFNECKIVPIIKLDTFCTQESINKIDFIWIDTQGAELDIIMGGQNSLKKTKYMYSEYYDSEMYEGQVSLNTWLDKLPGKWKILEKFPNDILLENLEVS